MLFLLLGQDEAAPIVGSSRLRYMDLGPVRALVLDLNFGVHGVLATVTRPAPDNVPIETLGIWLQPVAENFPGGMDFQRREPQRVMALRTDEVPTVPRGTIITAPEKRGDAVQAWRVDGIDRYDADHVRVVVIPEP